MNKSILFVTVTFPPRLSVASLRLYNYAKLFRDNGWVVTVITAAQKGENKSDEFDLNGIKVIHVPWKDPYSSLISIKNQNIRKILLKLFSYFIPYLATWIPDLRFLTWRKNAFQEVKNLMKSEQFTHVFSTYSPPSPHMVGSKLKAEYPNLYWIAEFRDLMSFSHSNKWWEYPLALIHNKIERKLLDKCDEILCVSEGHAEIMQLSLKRKINVLYNGCDFNSYKDIPVIKDDSFVILYTGNIYRKRNDLYLFFQALSEVILESNRNIQMRFVGTTKNRYLLNLIRKYSLNNNVSFIERSIHSTVKQYQKSADLLLHFCWSKKSQKGNLTGKIFEYISARRPILSIGIQDELSIILSKTNSGKICQNKMEIKEFIKLILSTDHTLQELSNEKCIYSKLNQFKSLENRLLKK